MGGWGGGICKLQTSAILLFKTVQIRPSCSVVCIFLCVCLREDNLLFRMYPNTDNFDDRPLISSKPAWGFPQGLNCTSRSRLTQREGMPLCCLSSSCHPLPLDRPPTTRVTPQCSHPCTHGYPPNPYLPPADHWTPIVV